MRNILIVSVLLAGASATVYGVPIAADEHPRLSVTVAELETARTRAATEPLVARGLRDLVQQADNAFTGAAIAIPEHDSGRNMHLIGRAVSLGYGALINGRKDWARESADILLAYAAIYPRRTADPEGRIYKFTLQESMWLSEAAVAADLVFASGVLTESERQQIIDGLLRPAVAEVMTDRRIRDGKISGHHACYNWQAWHITAVGLVAFLLNDDAMVNWAIDGEYGFRHLLSHDIRDDGLFWERSFGYQAFVINAVSRLLDAAMRAGRDVWNLSTPDDSTQNEWGSGNYTLDGDNGPKTVAMMLEAARDYVFPDLSAAPVGDSGRSSLVSLVPWLELALTRTNRRLVAQTLNSVYRQTVPAPYDWRTWAPDGNPAFSTGMEAGVCTLIIENRAAADRGCWVSPRVSTEGHREVDVLFRYRTADVDRERAVLVRVIPRAQGSLMSDRAVLITVPPSTEWAAVERRIELPPETDSLCADPFLWHAAGRVEFTELAIHAAGGHVLLDPAEFRHISRRRPGNILPWNLTPELPETEPQANEQFGTTGLRREWCSLFPASGFAVLREEWEGRDASAALLSFGPYGGGHGHPDMLKLVARAGGQTVLAAIPFFDYGDPRHGSWTNVTLAHNTVVIDQTSQFPGGTGSGWGNIRPDRLVQGKLLAFHAETQVKAVRARCDNAHLGMTLDRSVALLGDVLLDVFQVQSDDGKEHVFDYVLHLNSPPRLRQLEPVPREPLGDSQGYEHLGDLHAARSNASIVVDVNACTLVIAGAPDTEIITATAPHRDGPRSPLLIVRRRGKQTSFGLALAPETAVGLSLEGGLLRAEIGPHTWTMNADSEHGLRVSSERGEWQIGGIGEPTHRRGPVGAATWAPFPDGGVFIPKTQPQ